MPEAIGLLRSVRKAPAISRLIPISAADPLNLVGILTPGPRITAIAPNRILLRDGVPQAALEADQVVPLEPATAKPDHAVQDALRLGSLPAPLRPYYA
ncbi:MAG: hypothetical protein DME25_05245 [Verrucomicrobia bacterium]|nr:MAG: hypothetical protein DME25_05245 [Verrucomicrobiota bacterium]